MIEILKLLAPYLGPTATVILFLWGDRMLARLKRGRKARQRRRHPLVMLAPIDTIRLPPSGRDTTLAVTEARLESLSGPRRARSPTRARRVTGEAMADVSCNTRLPVATYRSRQHRGLGESRPYDNQAGQATADRLSLVAVLKG